MNRLVTTNLKVYYLDGTVDVFYEVVHCRNYDDGRHLTFADGRELFLHGVQRVRYFLGRQEEVDDD